MHFDPIWTFYVFQFSRYCSSKLAFFLLLQCCHFASLEIKYYIFRKVGLNLFEKQIIYNSDPLLCFDNNTAKTLFETRKPAVSFWNFVCSWRSWITFFGEKTFWGEKDCLRGNLNWYILGTEGRRRLKFGEVSIKIWIKYFREKTEQKIFELNALLSGVLSKPVQLSILGVPQTWIWGANTYQLLAIFVIFWKKKPF